jgi:fimbrial chaperone protein
MRFSPARRIAWWLCGLSWLIGLGQAQAFQVRPVRVDLNHRQTAMQLVVSNPTDRMLLVQAEAFDWSQDGARDSLQPSQSLIVNPPIFELAPGAQQVLRVGLRRAAEPGVERPYRIWLSQVATPGATGDTGVQMLLRLSLPVFVTGSDTGTPLPQWQREPDNGSIELANAGARHVHVRELRLNAEGADPLVLGPCYALPGGMCRWNVPPGLRERALRIEADSDAGTLQTRLDAAPSR